MLVLEVLAGLLLLAALWLAALVLRRRLLQRQGGTIDLSLRLRAVGRRSGWALGVGRFQGDDLRWYRVFSLAPRPRRVLSRRDLAVTGRRQPAAGEALALLDGAVVMHCSSADGAVELAMDRSAVAGFLAWLEARPPGATLPS